MKKIIILFIVMMFVSVACGTKTVEIGNPDFTDNESVNDKDAGDENNNDSDELTSQDSDSVVNSDEDSVIIQDEDLITVPDDDSACTAGEKKCDSAKENVLECSAEGNWTVAEDCTDPLKMCGENSGSYSCIDLNCEPDMKFCKDGDIYLCNSDGLSEVLSQTCTTTQYCNDSIDPITCSDMVCTPNAVICDGDTLKVCNEIGSNEAVKECTGGMTCDSSIGECLFTSDSGGNAVSTYSMARKGNFYNCTKDVTVVEFSQGLNFSGTISLGWAIYEDSDGDSTYQKIFDESKSVLGTGDAFYSSGKISVQLKSGRKYIFMTQWQENISFKYGSSHPVDMGFGSISAGLIQDYASFAEEEVNPSQQNFVYRQQIKYIEN